jgi:hypothetical protein
MKEDSMWKAILVGVAGAAVIACGAESPSTPEIAATYGDQGLQSLTVMGANRLADGAVRVTQVRLADRYRNPQEMEDPYVKDTRTFSDASLEVRGTRFNPADKRLTQTFDWGSVAVRYAVADNRLDLRVDVANTSPQTIERVALDLLALNVPADARNSNNGNDLVNAALSVSAPAVTRFNRAFFPADASGDDLLDEPGKRTVRPEAGEARVFCAACYPQAVREHLMTTKREARLLGQVSEGVCAGCKAETHLPADPLIVAGTPQAQPVIVLWEAGAPGAIALKLVIGDEKAPEMLDGVWYVRPVKPGTTDTTEVSLFFGAADGDPLLVARTSLESRAKANPFRIRWPDRRPIGMAHLCYDRGPERNPRGWWGFKDTQDDIRTPEGRAAFDKWIMGYADQVINVCEKSGSQGVIVWDLEGKQYPGAVYYGDPRIMKYTAPEMESMADAFFKKLREAGLRVGVCLRPNQIYPVAVKPEEVEKYREPNFFANLPYTESWERFNLASYGMEFWSYDELGQKVRTPLTDIKRSPVERLDARIRYCKERWGATLFYVDTDQFRRPRAKSGPNAAGGYDVLERWESKMMNPADWAELQRRHPDVLLIPEHETVQYWASTAPYRQPPYDGETHPAARLMYPESFSALALNGNAESEIRRNMAPYRAAVQAGDLMMHPAWYGPSDVVTNLYADAAATAPLRVTLRADGSFTLQGSPVADLGKLKAQVAGIAKGKPFAERRVSFQYAPAAARPARAAAIAALEQADAIIVWSQPLVPSR